MQKATPSTKTSSKEHAPSIRERSALAKRTEDKTISQTAMHKNQDLTKAERLPLSASQAQLPSNAGKDSACSSKSIAK